jgi:hypothetical protein
VGSVLAVRLGRPDVPEALVFDVRDKRFLAPWGAWTTRYGSPRVSTPMLQGATVARSIVESIAAGDGEVIQELDVSRRSASLH